MEIYTDLSEIDRTFKKPIVTIGNFDGVHVGHQILFSEVMSRAYRENGTSIAITFYPHPLKVVKPDIGIKLISTCDQKRELIEMAGLDVLIILPFTRQMAAIPAEKFVDDILIEKIGVQQLIIGYDYALGRDREGDIAFLKEQGRRKGFPVTVVDAFYVDGILASSSKVRELVTAGEMQKVKKILGRYYQIRGQVKRGKQRGGPLLGFPTANLEIDSDDLCPRHGVYVTQVVYQGKCYGGVLNIGYNPTFSEKKISAETHIFDFNQDIYGQDLKINLLAFLRPEKKFSGPEELARQISTDVARAKEILADAEKELLLSCEERYNR